MNTDPMYRWKLTGLAASTVIVLTIPVYAVKELGHRSQLPAPDGSVAVFVGRDRCIDCHEQAYASWHDSDHDKGNLKIKAATLFSQHHLLFFQVHRNRS